MIAELPPFAVFFAGAPLVMLLRGRLQQGLLLLIPLLSAALLLAYRTARSVKMQLDGL